jgi:hypothetical protein
MGFVFATNYHAEHRLEIVALCRDAAGSVTGSAAWGWASWPPGRHAEFLPELRTVGEDSGADLVERLHHQGGHCPGEKQSLAFGRSLVGHRASNLDGSQRTHVLSSPASIMAAAFARPEVDGAISHAVIHISSFRQSLPRTRSGGMAEPRTQGRGGRSAVLAPGFRQSMPE